jgi:hypothetical protein
MDPFRVKLFNCNLREIRSGVYRGRSKLVLKTDFKISPDIVRTRKGYITITIKGSSFLLWVKALLRSKKDDERCILKWWIGLLYQILVIEDLERGLGFWKDWLKNSPEYLAWIYPPFDILFGSIPAHIGPDFFRI